MMGLLEMFGRKPAAEPKAAYTIATTISPLRLTAHRTEEAEIAVELTNNASEARLTSLIVALPKGISFDQIGLEAAREIRLGELAPSQSRTLNLKVWGGQRTEPGSYTIAITALGHFRKYSYISSKTKKLLVLRVV